MKKKAFIYIGVLLVVFVIAASFAAVKRVNQNKKIALEEKQETAQSLFEASSETLEYANYLFVYGYAYADELEKKTYKTFQKMLDFTYERTFSDPYDNMSLLKGSCYYYTGNELNKTRKFEYYSGYVHAQRQAKLYENDTNNYIICPEIKRILFPTLRKQTVTLSDVRTDVPGYENQSIIIATVSGNFEEFELEYKSFMGNSINLNVSSLVYYFDADKRVLNKVVGYDCSDVEFFEIIVKEYDFHEHKMLSMEDHTIADDSELKNENDPKSITYHYSKMNEVLDETIPVVLKNEIVTAYDTGLFSPLDNYWHEHSTSIWNAIYDNGAQYTITELEKKADEVAKNHGYDSASLSYCVVGNDEFSSVIIFRLLFENKEKGTGSILIPLSFVGTDVKGGCVLLSMGDDEALVGNNAWFMLKKKIGHNCEAKIHGEIRYTSGFGINHSIVTEYPAKSLTDDDELKYFIPEYRERLKQFAEKYPDSKYVGVSLHKFTRIPTNPFAYDMDVFLELYFPDYVEDYTYDKYFEDELFVGSSEYHMNMYSSQFIQDYGETIYVKMWDDEDVATWYEW